MNSASGSKRIKTTAANTKKGQTRKPHSLHKRFGGGIGAYSLPFPNQEVERTLCVPGGHFQCNKQGQPLHIKRSLFTPICKYWVEFIHANISLCSYVSDLTISGAIFLFFILQGQPINIACWVDASTPPFERPRKTIDRSYYLQYCLIDEEGQPIPTPQPPRPHRRNHPDHPIQPDPPGTHDPYHMFDMRMALLDAKLEAVNRIGLAHADMMRHVYASSHLGFITPEDYAARLAWPRDQAHSSGGGGISSGAQAMEEDEEDESDDGEEEDESDEEGIGDSDS
ncbi:hypothetical protein LR48_Vigan10g132500 [Vigna angularis]|uniref:Putative plant transposon protein domain-containing protein n=1 Tax=Phaseolus angularis TaxID=3914 RepID=A0A0L9VKB7_PHAAN|nr:hypothetical protein LR48_Vigan10g132500 [Vigna angularis]